MKRSAWTSLSRRIERMAKKKELTAYEHVADGLREELLQRIKDAGLKCARGTIPRAYSKKRHIPFIHVKDILTKFFVIFDRDKVIISTKQMSWSFDTMVAMMPVADPACCDRIFDAIQVIASITREMQFVRAEHIDRSLCL